MAKKNTLSTTSGSNSIFDLVKSFDKSAEILGESKTAVIKDYISTGNYMLNAAMTGSLFKGVPAGRVVTLAGDPGCLEKNETVDVYILEGKSQHHNKVVEGEACDNRYEYKKSLTRDVMIENLRRYYDYYTDKYVDALTDEELINAFNLHCSMNTIKLKIRDMYDYYSEKFMLIDTPDGFAEIGDLVKKKPRKIYVVQARSGRVIKCSNDHMIETPTGWIKTEDLKLDDIIITRDGEDSIMFISPYKIDDVYDLEVLTDNHRYWGGHGISSHNTGKTYLALSICREAQKKGYTPIYMDSEGSIDIDFVKRLGCDPDNFMIRQVNTISEVSTFIANICEHELSLPESERHKIVMVLDSLGNLTSDKEKKTTLEGGGAKDMTKQQEIKALFRTNATPLAKLGIPFLCCNHIYQTQEMFSKTVVSGGCLTPDTPVITETGPKKISLIQVGERVLDEYGLFSKVVETFKFKKPTYTIQFAIDTEPDSDNEEVSVVEMECSKDHRFLVKVAEGDYQWKKAESIEENNEVLRLTEYTSSVSEIKIRPQYETCRVVSKHENPETDVCDLCVDYSHTYVTENGIINHNSGINYNSSITMLLSVAKLEDKESDKIVEKKVGEYQKTGVLVSAKSHKSRFTIPQKVKFQIPYFKAPNPYVGLEAYLTWENSGILRGEMLTEKDYEKLTDGEKEKCYEFIVKEGKEKVKYYAHLKDISKKLVVKHLGCEVPVAELFTEKVLTEELLKNLDETVIRPNFELPSNESTMDIEEMLGENDGE